MLSYLFKYRLLQLPMGLAEDATGKSCHTCSNTGFYNRKYSQKSNKEQLSYLFKYRLLQLDMLLGYYVYGEANIVIIMFPKTKSSNHRQYISHSE